MLWIQEGKQLCRTPIRTLAFCLALAVVIGLLSITTGLWLATEDTVNTVEDMYVTVASIPRTTLGQYASFSLYNIAREEAGDLYADLKNGTITLENATDIETHSWLLAYDLAHLPTTSGTFSSEDYSYQLNKPQNLSLFAVTCAAAEISRESTVYGSDGKELDIRRTYNYAFDVHEALSIHPDLTVPSKLTLETAVTRNGTDPLFEMGHNYLVWGYYDVITEKSGTLTIPSAVSNDTKISSGMVSRGSLRDDLWESERVLYINCPRNVKALYRLPIIGEYSGSATAYLDADQAGMWNKLLEFLNIEHHTVRIWSANEVRALKPFASGTAYITEGTTFTEEDIAQGRKVAIISDVYAEACGLKVGDTLDLSFYNAEWNVSNNLNSTQAEIGMLKPSTIYGINKNDFAESSPENPVTDNNGVYTVVGIYGGNNWQDDYRVMHPNTVIVPSTALIRTYTPYNQYDLCLSLIIPNGGIDAVEEELTAQGYGERLQYDDGGYSVIMPNIITIRDSAVFINNITLVLWVIVVITVLILFTVMLVPAGRVKYRLGTGKYAIWGQMTFSMLLILLISGIAGGIGSIMLYDRALEWMTQTNFTTFNDPFTARSEHAEELEQILLMLGQEPRVFVISAAVQVAILAVIGTVLCAVVALRKKGFKQ